MAHVADSVSRWDAWRAIGALQRWAQEHGRQPTWNGWHPPPAGMPSRHVLIRIFGSWRTAMAAAGFEPLRRGERIGEGNFETPCVNAACDRVRGRGSSRGRCQRCAAYWRRTGEEWTGRRRSPGDMAARRDASVAAVRDLMATLGRRPTFAEYRAHAVRAVLLRRPDSAWGSWAAFLRAAGIEPRRYNRVEKDAVFELRNGGGSNGGRATVGSREAR